MRSYRSLIPAALDLASLVLLVIIVMGLLRRGTTADAQPPFLLAAIPVDSLLQPVPVLDAAGVLRDVIKANAEGGSHLILVFRTDCTACEVQKPLWLQLAREASAAGVQVVAVTPEPLIPEVLSYFEDVPAAVLQLSDPATIHSVLYTRVTPTTILVEPGRRVAVHVQGLVYPAELVDITYRLAGNRGSGSSTTTPTAKGEL